MSNIARRLIWHTLSLLFIKLFHAPFCTFLSSLFIILLSLFISEALLYRALNDISLYSRLDGAVENSLTAAIPRYDPYMYYV